MTERRRIAAELKLMNMDIWSRTKLNNTQIEKLKAPRTQLAEEKKVRQALKKRLGKSEKPLREGIEQMILPRFGIKRAAHHGGDFVGQDIQKLILNAIAIFSAIADFIKEESDPSSRGAIDKEIDDMFWSYERDFQVWYAAFALMRSNNWKPTRENKAIVKDAIHKALKIWRNLKIIVTVKAHAVEDHCLDQMIEFGGIGLLGEDVIEQTHQTGRSEEERTAALRHFERKTMSHVKWEERKQNPRVIGHHIALMEKTKRNMKNYGQHSEFSKQAKLKAIQSVRTTALAGVEQIETKVTDGWQLNLADYKDNRNNSTSNN